MVKTVYTCDDMLYMQVPDVLTTSQGHPVDSKTSTLTIGPRGPVLLQDFTFIDEMAHFDRERIPERVVHAKGAGAWEDMWLWTMGVNKSFQIECTKV